MSSEAHTVTAIRALLRIDDEEETSTIRDLAERIGRCPEMVVALMELAVRQRWEIAALKDAKGPTYPSYELMGELRKKEREGILEALEANDWIVLRTARDLGIPVNTLRYKMRGFKIARRYDTDESDDEEGVECG